MQRCKWSVYDGFPGFPLRHPCSVVDFVAVVALKHSCDEICYYFLSEIFLCSFFLGFLLIFIDMETNVSIDCSSFFGKLSPDGSESDPLSSFPLPDSAESKPERSAESEY